MGLNLCGVCGRFYERDGHDNCLNCREADKKTYEILRECILQNSNIRVFEASNMTGIPIKTIMRYIEERRIHIIKNGIEKDRLYFRD